jgi:FkbM family methyltransferase
MINKAYYRFQRLVCPNEKQKLYNGWFAVKGDQTLRLEYPLTRHSLVFDVGGYKGDWASDIGQRYGCSLFVFEPVRQYAETIKERFKSDPRVRVFAYGLGAVNRTDAIGLSDDASSLFRKATNSVEIEIRDVVDFLTQEGVEQIDLMKINIEGGEYELLETLLQSGMCGKVNNFQIQFHDFVPGAEARMTAIHTGLARTHELTWQYRFIWENWKIRSFNDLSDN